MFQDGPNKAISSTSWCNRAEAELTFIPQSTPWYTRVKACRSKRSITQAFPTEWTHVDTHAHTISSRDCLNMYTHTTDLIRFPFNNFKYYLTLFSKFFSSFPHGTCSLSVSCHYLALDGIYHPFRTALPSNSTRWEAIVRCVSPSHERGFHPPWPSIPTEFCQAHNWFTLYRLQFKLLFDLQIELFPLHSPLLGES